MRYSSVRLITPILGDHFRFVGKPEVTIGPSRVRHGFAILSSVNHSPILLGTSSFTATGWQGSFYPKGLRPADYLSYYAQHFDTVEIDSTFYATPNVSVVRSWNAKTPEGFFLRPKYHSYEAMRIMWQND